MTTPQPPGTARNGSMIWIGALVVVVILGIAAVVVARGSGGDEEVDGQTEEVVVGGSSDSSTTGSDASSTDPEGETAATGLPQYDATLADDPAVGMTIPTVTGTNLDGDEMTISGGDGKAKVILFVAHWCPHCQKEVPLLKGHLDDNPMPDDVELLTVSTSVQPGAENYPPSEWLADEGWSAPVLADDENSSVAGAYGLSSFPYFVVVDADGKVVARASGELSTDEFDAAVKAAQG